MKVTASIKLYSGIRDPEQELTEEQSKEICHKLYDANQNSLKELLPRLGPQGYMVVWHSKSSPTVWLHVHEGIIALHCSSTVSYLRDTVGMETYLHNLLAEKLKQHLEGKDR